MAKNQNNRTWYTVFVRGRYANPDDWEVFGQIRGTGSTNLVVKLLEPTYDRYNIRTLEGKHNQVTEQLKTKYFPPT